MRRAILISSIGIVAIWGSYFALQQYPVARHFQKPRPAPAVASMSFSGEGATQDTQPPCTCLREPTRLRALILLVNNPFITSADASTQIEAVLFYNDTILRPRLLRDSVGIRLIGAQGAVAVEPSDIRYAQVRGKMGPWDWNVTPQRAGRYNLMLDFVRLPGDLEELLHMPDTAAVRRQGRSWYPSGPALNKSTPIPLTVLTSGGWTAEQDAAMKTWAWLLTLVFAPFPIGEFFRRKKK